MVTTQTAQGGRWVDKEPPSAPNPYGSSAGMIGGQSKAVCGAVVPQAPKGRRSRTSDLLGARRNLPPSEYPSTLTVADCLRAVYLLDGFNLLLGISKLHATISTFG